jgi:hypothetical protein
MLNSSADPLNVEMAATTPAVTLHEFTSLEQDCKTQLQAVSRRIAELGNYSAVRGNPDRSHILGEAQRVLARAQQRVRTYTLMNESLSTWNFGDDTTIIQPVFCRLQ